MSRRKGYGKYGVAAKADRTYNGVVYASKAEMKRAIELDMLVKAGEINRWMGQPRFELGPDVVYIADFHVVLNGERPQLNYLGFDMSEWIEDVKGCQTRVFKFKKKLWKKYGTMPLAIISGRKVEWVIPETMQKERT